MSSSQLVRIGQWALAVLGALACSQRPRLPKQITFEGTRLNRATTWSRGGVSGVVYVPEGEGMATASLQVGVLVSHEHASGAELHRWVMDQYRSSRTQQWYESSVADETCKVGLPETTPPRPFLALDVCRGIGGTAACAEVDERLDDATVGRCLNTVGCWDEMCFERWSSRRASLEALARQAVEGR